MRKTALRLSRPGFTWLCCPCWAALARYPAAGLSFLSSETGGLAGSDDRLVSNQCDYGQPDPPPGAGCSGKAGELPSGSW